MSSWFAVWLACGSSGEGHPAPAPVAEAPAAAAVPAAPAAPKVEPGGPATNALVGTPAPDFTLKDLAGADVSLASFKGKTVVLEWFNPGCPFVKAAHGAGSLAGAADRHLGAGVVWLAVNSSAAGKEGNALDENTAAVATWGMKHPVLRDEDGKVGKAYGATNTPQLVVIDPTGTIRYVGAIDNSPDGEGKTPIGGTLVNWVDQALADLAAGRPVATPATKPYGCGVKYGA